MTTKPIGLIGAGLLGGAIAARLLEAGFRVIGYDTGQAKRTELEAAGALLAAGPSEIAAKCDRVILSLPNSHIASEVIGQMAPVLEPGSLVIDTTTGSPHDAEAAAETLEARGCGYMDASVGGSSKQTRAGEVVVMAGARPADFAAAGPIFATFARRTFHLGPPGAGARMKLVFNMVLGLNRAVLGEALAFSERYELPGAQVLEILKDGATYSKVMDTKGAKMLSCEFTPPEARLAQHLKDVRLMLKESQEIGANTPLTELHERLLSAAVEMGFEAADNSAVVEVFRKEKATA